MASQPNDDRATSSPLGSPTIRQASRLQWYRLPLLVALLTLCVYGGRNTASTFVGETVQTETSATRPSPEGPDPVVADPTPAQDAHVMADPAVKPRAEEAPATPAAKAEVSPQVVKGQPISPAPQANRSDNQESPRVSPTASGGETFEQGVAVVGSSLKRLHAGSKAGAEYILSLVQSLRPTPQSVAATPSPSVGDESSTSDVSTTATADDLDAETDHSVPQPPAADPAPGLTLRNVPESGETIHYLLDQKAYALRPGESQSVSSGSQRVVQFHRGGEFGDALYSLSEGTYIFHGTQHGWELSRVPDLPPSASRP